MKNHLNILQLICGCFLLMTLCTLPSVAQDDMSDEREKTTTTLKPVKNMFESVWLIDNQTVLVPIPGTFEFDIQHRFGTIKNGYEDLYGLYAPSNIRLGFNYTIVQNLMLGFGLTKQNLSWDFNAKYAIFQQSRSGGYPVSLTYYVNATLDGRKKENFINSTDKFSYFHQLMLARKVSEKLSVQGAFNLAHYNAVEGYITSENLQKPKMKNDHLSFSLLGRYKTSDAMAIIVNYDQPITKHLTNNPNPNLSFGIELATSSHAFQIFLGNYYNLIPQRNHMFNNNNYEDGKFLIGFNITRLWNW